MSGFCGLKKNTRLEYDFVLWAALFQVAEITAGNPTINQDLLFEPDRESVNFDNMKIPYVLLPNMMESFAWLPETGYQALPSPSFMSRFLQEISEQI